MRLPVCYALIKDGGKTMKALISSRNRLVTSTNDPLRNIMQTQGRNFFLVRANISLNLHNKLNVRLGTVQQVYIVRIFGFHAVRVEFKKEV